MLYFDTMAQIAIAVRFLLTNNVKKFMSKILAILAKNLDSWPGSTLSWSVPAKAVLPRSGPGRPLLVAKKGPPGLKWAAKNGPTLPKVVHRPDQSL